MNENNLDNWALGKNIYQWIIDNIQPGSVIVELGSGSGSHELGKTYNMHCVEHDVAWLHRYSNIWYYFAPVKDGWYNSDFISALPKDYALLIIDGPPSTIGRSGILRHIEKFRMDIPIIIDDTNRDEEMELKNIICTKYNLNSFDISDVNKKSTILWQSK